MGGIFRGAVVQGELVRDNCPGGKSLGEKHFQGGNVRIPPQGMKSSILFKINIKLNAEVS